MRRLRIALPLFAGLGLALLAPPDGLAPHAWRYFAVFVTVILALITEPLPAAAVGWIGVTFVAVTGVLFSPAQHADSAFKAPAEAIKWALAGFSNATVWLIFGAFVFSLGYEKTGLGRRIALVLVRRLGGRTLGLGYAITLADLVLAPFTPSNTARSAGAVYPIIRNIPALYGAGPDEAPRKIGAYLMWVAFASTCVTSAMFVTALAPNLLLVNIVRDRVGIGITWTQWALGFLPIGVPLLAALPWLIFRLFPPEITSSAEVPAWAARELVAMGRVTRAERIMAGLVGLALGSWIFAGRWIDPTTTALAVIALLLITRTITWDDLVAHKAAWNILAWFATLVALADGLSRVGFISWFGQRAATVLSGYPPTFVMLMLVVVFFLIHYLFASLTAHTTALLPVVLAAGAAVPDLPLQPFVMLLGYSLGLMGVLTPYATGPAPVYYACGFLDRRDFWRLGLVFGAIFLAALLALGAWMLLMR
jgi:L-tartrate/succinate antiporter